MRVFASCMSFFCTSSFSLPGILKIQWPSTLYYVKAVYRIFLRICACLPRLFLCPSLPPFHATTPPAPHAQPRRLAAALRVLPACVCVCVCLCVNVNVCVNVCVNACVCVGAGPKKKPHKEDLEAHLQWEYECTSISCSRTASSRWCSETLAVGVNMPARFRGLRAPR